jgi:hypothetical protein
VKATSNSRKYLTGSAPLKLSWYSPNGRSIWVMHPNNNINSPPDKHTPVVLGVFMCAEVTTTLF